MTTTTTTAEIARPTDTVLCVAGTDIKALPVVSFRFVFTDVRNSRPFGNFFSPPLPVRSLILGRGGRFLTLYRPPLFGRLKRTWTAESRSASARTVPLHPNRPVSSESAQGLLAVIIIFARAPDYFTNVYRVCVRIVYTFIYIRIKTRIIFLFGAFTVNAVKEAVELKNCNTTKECTVE